MNFQRLLLILACVACLTTALRPRQTNSVNGTWQTQAPSGATVLLTIADHYLIQTTYEPTRFIATTGGSFQPDGDAVNLLVEFDTVDSSRVGQREHPKLAVRDNQLVMSSPAGTRTFSRVAETPTPLTGLWRITGRANTTGELTSMQRGPRKTIKLLTGSRFQWVAINPETKQFFGTGGGTYTLNNGKYTETIHFFSRDNSRAGKSLTFDATVTQDEWLHSGQSSTHIPFVNSGAAKNN